MSKVSYVRMACKEIDEVQWIFAHAFGCSYEVEKLKNIINSTGMRDKTYFTCLIFSFNFPQEHDLKSKVSFRFQVLIHIHYIESDFRLGGEVRTKKEQLPPSVRRWKKWRAFSPALILQFNSFPDQVRVMFSLTLISVFVIFKLCKYVIFTYSEVWKETSLPSATLHLICITGETL